MNRLSVRRAAVLSVAAFGLLTTTGCIGSFQLTRKLYAFNTSVSEDKFVQELVFLALAVPQVYSLVAIVDAVFPNLVEFWTGTNPVASARTLRPDGTALVQTGTTTPERKTFVIDEVKDGVTLSTTTITNRIGEDAVTVETRLKDGRTFRKTVTRQADGNIVME